MGKLKKVANDENYFISLWLLIRIYLYYGNAAAVGRSNLMVGH